MAIGTGRSSSMVVVDSKKLKKIGTDLSREKIDACITKAIDRTLEKVCATGKKALKAEYNIPAKYLDLIKIKKTSAKRGYIFSNRKPLPLNAFSPRFETPSKIISTKNGRKSVKGRKTSSKSGKGVSIEVHKGSRKVIPFAFMIPGRKVRVFARGRYTRYGFLRRNRRDKRSGSDIQIKPLLTMSVGAAFTHKRGMALMTAEAKSFSKKAFEQEIKAAIRKI